MVNDVLHKFFSVTLALLVLFSTMSFTMNMHYCGGNLVETAMFHKAKGCGMEMQTPSIEDCAITKKNCCNDEQLVIDGQDELQLQINPTSFEQHLFIASFVYTYISLFDGFDKNIASHEAYKPPLVVRQIYKLDEIYLI